MKEAEAGHGRPLLSALGAFLEEAHKRTFGAVFDALAAARNRRNEMAFSVALIALSAKMARADGVVTDDEVGAFQNFFEFPESEAKHVRIIYELAQQDVAGFDHYLKRVAELYEDQPTVLEDVLDCLYYVATADGVEHPREREMLERAAASFKLAPSAVRRIRSVHFGQDREDPFAILGVEPDSSPETIKAAYRSLIRVHHPDALIARGVPPALVKIAEARSAAINGAYERALAAAAR